MTISLLPRVARDLATRAHVHSVGAVTGDGRHPARLFFICRAQCHGARYPMPGWRPGHRLSMVPWLPACIALSTGGVP